MNREEYTKELREMIDMAKNASIHTLIGMLNLEKYVSNIDDKLQDWVEEDVEIEESFEGLDEDINFDFADDEETEEHYED